MISGESGQSRQVIQPPKPIPHISYHIVPSQTLPSAIMSAYRFPSYGRDFFDATWDDDAVPFVSLLPAQMLPTPANVTETIAQPQNREIKVEIEAFSSEDLDYDSEAEIEVISIVVDKKSNRSRGFGIALDKENGRAAERLADEKEGTTCTCRKDDLTRLALSPRAFEFNVLR